MLEEQPSPAPDTTPDNTPAAGTLITNGAGIIGYADDASASLLNTPPRFLAGKPLIVYVSRDETRQFTTRLIAARRTPQNWTTRLVPLYRPPVAVLVQVQADAAHPMTPLQLHWRLAPAAGDGFIVPRALLPPVVDEATAGIETMRRAFLSAMTHELLTPLAIIQGHAETLRYPAVREDQRQVDHALEAIRDETGRLRRLVQNVIDSARASSGELTVRPSPTPLEPMLKRAVARFEARSRRHRFALDVAEPLPAVLADEERLESVLYNLLDNALKYSPRGGQIRVYAQPRPQEIEVGVEDEGLTVPPGEESQVFAPYYRVRQGNGGAQGSGLGLYLSRAVIDGHGGRIWMERRPEGGTAVRFTLPTA